MLMHYDISKEHIVHEEQVVELDYDPGSYIEFDGEHFDLKQFHFHTPSEHWINDESFDLEMHMVHQSVKDDQYLVIAFLFEAGEPDHFISQFLQDVPEGEQHIDNDRKYIDINQELLPENFTSYYYYEGSLTTPPYSENVSWIVDTRIHRSSAAQIEKLILLEGDNHRGVQHINDRIVEKVSTEKEYY